MKNFLNRAAYHYRDHPAWAGVFREEMCGFLAGLSKLREEELDQCKAYLREKYTSSELEEKGIEDIDALNLPMGMAWRKKDPQEAARSIDDRLSTAKLRFLWTEYAEYQNQKMLDGWKEATYFLHALRKATYTVTGDARGVGSRSLWLAQMADVVDVPGMEIWESGSMYTPFFLDLVRNGRDRQPIAYQPAVFISDTDRYVRDMAIGILHAELLIPWVWRDLWKYPPKHRKRVLFWHKDKWQATKRIYDMIGKVEPYLVNTERRARTAQLYSGRTSVFLYRDADGMKGKGRGRPTRYIQNQIGIYQALLQSHIDFAPVFLDDLTGEKLSRYNVAVLSDAKAMSDEEVERVKAWVNAGGILISTGTTSLFDRWSIQRSDYGLSEVFGVEYGATEIELPLEKIYLSVYRESKKPLKIREFTIAERHPLLGDLRTGQKIEYGQDAGYDQVEVSAGKVVAKWQDGSPAVVVNDYGEGWSVFVSAIYPGTSHTEKEYSHQMRTSLPVFRDFWPGAREFLESLVRGALEQAGAKSDCRVSDCPTRTETAVKYQKGRTIVHFLNRDEHQKVVEGVKVTLRVSEEGEARVFYALDAAPVSYERIDSDYISFVLRPFDLYEMVVVERK